MQFHSFANESKGMEMQRSVSFEKKEKRVLNTPLV